MKRILPIILTLCVIVSCLAIPAFASTKPNGATSPEDGGLYRKILYWQDYVLSSTENSDGKWTTRIGMPKASLWELNDNAGWRSDSWYTDDTSSGYFHLDERDLYLEWSNAYFISLEDINYIDLNNFSFIAQSSFLMTSVDVVVSFYDAYLNQVSLIHVGGGGFDGTNVVGDNLSFAFGESNYSLGAKYFRFHVNIGYQQVDPETNQWFNFHWSVDLPFEYDPLRYPVDGIDSWMNGYFKPIVPDSSGESDIWEHFRQNQVLFKEFITSVRDTFAYYAQGFRFWSYAFLQFYSINWVGQLINASIAIGAIAFFFGIAIEASGKIGSKKGKGNGKYTHSTSTSSPDKHNKIKKKGEHK